MGPTAWDLVRPPLIGSAPVQRCSYQVKGQVAADDDAGERMEAAIDEFVAAEKAADRRSPVYGSSLLR